VDSQPNEDSFSRYISLDSQVGHKDARNVQQHIKKMQFPVNSTCPLCNRAAQRRAK